MHPDAAVQHSADWFPVAAEGSARAAPNAAPGSAAAGVASAAAAEPAAAERAAAAVPAAAGRAAAAWAHRPTGVPTERDSGSHSAAEAEPRADAGLPAFPSSAAGHWVAGRAPADLARPELPSAATADRQTVDSTMPVDAAPEHSPAEPGRPASSPTAVCHRRMPDQNLRSGQHPRSGLAYCRAVAGVAALPGRQDR